MVDGSPVLYRSSEKDSFSGYYKKTLIFGERRGGKSYWLLDVTSPDPDDWKVKCHIQGGDSTEGVNTYKTTRIEELGYTWSKPAFTRLRISSTTVKDVVIFTGGYDPKEDKFPEEFNDADEDGLWDTGEAHSVTTGGTEGFDKYNPGADDIGRGIFVVDIDTGDVLFKATYGNIDSTSGNEQTYKSMKYCFPADPTVISFSDSNKVIYTADVYGQIWKVVFNNGTWKVQTVFKSNPGYALTTGSTDISTAVENSDDSGRKTFYSPDVGYYGNDWTGRPVLYFGTGDREHPKLNLISDRFYTIVDTGTTTNEGNLLNLTCDELDVDSGVSYETKNALENLLIDGTAKGFYRILDQEGDCITGMESHIGEKILSKPALFAGVVYFTSYQPVLGEPCNPLGSAYIYALDYSFGTAAYNYDKDNDDTTGNKHDIQDTFVKIDNSAIASGLSTVIRNGETAGFVSAGDSVVGVGEDGSSSIIGPEGGVSQLFWKTKN